MEVILIMCTSYDLINIKLHDSPGPSANMLGTFLSLLIFCVLSIEAVALRSSYLDGGAVVILESSKLSSQIVKDVLQSTLYAQMMASHEYNRFNEFSAWYAALIKAYGEVGWTIYTSDFEVNIDNYSISDEAAVMKVLSKDLSVSEQSDVQDVLKVIYGNHTLAGIFNKETLEGTFRNFQVLVIKVGNSGEVVMSFTGFVVDGISSTFRDLFCSFGLGILKDGDFSAHRENVSLYLQGFSGHVIQVQRQ